LSAIVRAGKFAELLGAAWYVDWVRGLAGSLSVIEDAEEAMSRRLKQAAIVFVVLFAAAQLMRPSRVALLTDPGRTIQAHETTKGLAAVLDRSCGDCHSNATVSRWYTEVAPLSWVMASAVTKGRNVVNFSEWASYPPEQQRILLSLSCQDASEGKMPGPYVRFRSDTRLSTEDVATICAAARQADARAGGATR